jgi:hypothetical protein
MWVHSCNVTAYRNAVRLQVTDTIRSYDLNFHAMPHGVKPAYPNTSSCEAKRLVNKAVNPKALQLGVNEL